MPGRPAASAAQGERLSRGPVARLLRECGAVGGGSGAPSTSQALALDGSTDTARNAADAIVAIRDGLQVQWLLEPGSVDMAASTDLVVTSLLTALAPGRFGPAAGS